MAMLPTGLKFASLAIGNRKQLPATDAEKFLREIMAETFGPLQIGMSYLSTVYPTTATLSVNNLLQLLMHGETTIAVLLNESPSDGGIICLMPWGTKYTATLETCGINRADLLALGDKLTLPAQTAATPAPVMPAGASDGTPDPERRLARLRELGGNAKYSRCVWQFTGIGKLVESEKSERRNRNDEKTIRADLREAAQAEHDAKRAGFGSGLGRVHANYTG